jgi:hypothetical protein
MEIDDKNKEEDDGGSDDILKAALNSFDINSSMDSSWIVDSRAARHATGQKNVLSDIETNDM